MGTVLVVCPMRWGDAEGTATRHHAVTTPQGLAPLGTTRELPVVPAWQPQAPLYLPQDAGRAGKRRAVLGDGTPRGPGDGRLGEVDDGAHLQEINPTECQGRCCSWADSPGWRQALGDRKDALRGLTITFFQ